MENVPLPEREAGFYSRYFIKTFNFRSAWPEPYSAADIQFQDGNAQTHFLPNSIRGLDWFVTIDLKDAYLHVEVWPEHKKLSGSLLEPKLTSIEFLLSAYSLASTHLYGVHGYGPGYSVTPGHQCAQLH